MSVFPSSPVFCDSTKTSEDASAAPGEQVVLEEVWVTQVLSVPKCHGPSHPQGWPWSLAHAGKGLQLRHWAHEQGSARWAGLGGLKS